MTIMNVYQHNMHVHTLYHLTIMMFMVLYLPGQLMLVLYSTYTAAHNEKIENSKIYLHVIQG